MHGDGFEFLRNDALDARNFFDPTKAELRRNQFGYAVGGPFWRNKLFWFTDYQGTRQTQGASTGLVAVPTVAERQGQFDPSTFVDSNGNPTTVQGAYWASVLSQRLGYNVQNGEQYSNPGCATTAVCVFPGGVIPQSAFSKPAHWHSSLHSRPEPSQWLLRQLEPKEYRARRQDGPARRFRQRKNRQLGLLLPL